MSDLSTIQFLFHEYCNIKMLGLEGADSLFHPVIDNARFMDASILVMRFILESKVLFIKPYIAFLAEEDMAHLWTCFISLNAGQIGVDQPKEKEHVCGYLHFSPIAEEGMVDHPHSALYSKHLHTLLPVAASRQCPGKKEFPATIPWSPGFKTLMSLLNYLMASMSSSILNIIQPCCGPLNFPQLSIPLAYLLIKLPVATMATITDSTPSYSCLTSANPLQLRRPSFGRMGESFGIWISLNYQAWARHFLRRLVNCMLLIILQLVDRVAETQLPSRTVAKEYVAFIKPKKATLLKKVTATIRLPKAGKRFPDCVGQSWKPCPPQLEGPMLKQLGEQRPTVASTLLSRKEDGVLPRIPRQEFLQEHRKDDPIPVKPSPLSPERAVIKRCCPKNPQRQREGDPKPASPSPLSTEGAVVVPLWICCGPFLHKCQRL